MTAEEKESTQITAKGGDDRREVALALKKGGAHKNMDDWDDVEGYYKVGDACAGPLPSQGTVMALSTCAHAAMLVGVWRLSLCHRPPSAS